MSRAEIAKSEAQMAQAKAALENAEEDLRNSTIVSPINGLVLSRDVSVGDGVSSILILGSQATLVMTLGDTSEVYVQGKVDEADIGKVYLGQPARIVVESFKDKKFTGKVTRISPFGKEKDNVTTFEVRVSISNPTGELKANMSANAEIILEEKKNVLMVPEASLIYDKDRNASVEIAGSQGRERPEEDSREAGHLQWRKDGNRFRAEREAASHSAITGRFHDLSRSLAGYASDALGAQAADAADHVRDRVGNHLDHADGGGGRGSWAAASRNNKKILAKT